jgi:hypothetical protein
MAQLEKVIFGVKGMSGERLSEERQYDRSSLRLGSKVYVRFPTQDERIEFSPNETESSIPHWVEWIAPSDWSIALVSQFELRQEYIERVQKEVEGHIDPKEAKDAITKFAGMIRMEHFYKTSELGSNPLSVVFTVIDRLAVCRRLRQSSPPWFLDMLLDGPLVSYLYLTCFDRLGQPADWLHFGAWMESSKNKAERDPILHQAQSMEQEDGIRFVYDEYTSLYGVRSSFFRFLRGLPVDFRRDLLDSIEQRIVTYPPSLTGRDATDEEKERYLFRRRNDYTHKADFRPPTGEWFGGQSAVPFRSSTQPLG